MTLAFGAFTPSVVVKSNGLKFSRISHSSDHVGLNWYFSISSKDEDPTDLSRVILLPSLSVILTSWPLLLVGMISEETACIAAVFTSSSYFLYPIPNLTFLLSCFSSITSYPLQDSTHLSQVIWVDSNSFLQT
ncbi:hypothetical protein Hanom_Chr10g00949981 [Helianthus anomalus]